jgi:hypothetical protein
MRDEYNDRVEISDDARRIAGGQGRSSKSVHDDAVVIVAIVCAAAGAIVGSLLYPVFGWLYRVIG